jgi:uncharacterized RDD family membrane protein YckC
MSETVDLLQDVEQEIPLESATVGQRFLNMLIDLAGFFVIIIGFGFFGALVWGESFVEGLDSINPIMDRILTSIAFGLYISVVEGLTKGRSLGKLVTRTKAVTIYNEPTTWSNSFARGFSRVVPFEALSAFGGNPWHDRWTDTRVVKIN